MKHIWGFILLYLILSVCVSCSQQEVILTSQEIPLATDDSSFPKFQNKHIFIQANGIKVSRFKLEGKDLSLQSHEMFICSNKDYFIPKTEYCMYFDKLWVQNVISSNNENKIIAIMAKSSYSDKVFSNFLFQNAIFSIKDSSFVLFSDVIHWDSRSSSLDSPAKSQHRMKNTDEEILEGQDIFLNYRSEYFTMKSVKLELKGDI